MVSPYGYYYYVIILTTYFRHSYCSSRFFRSLLSCPTIFCGRSHKYVFCFDMARPCIGAFLYLNCTDHGQTLPKYNLNDLTDFELLVLTAQTGPEMIKTWSFFFAGRNKPDWALKLKPQRLLLSYSLYNPHRDWEKRTLQSRLWKICFSFQSI